jgi:hypothetical protein
MIRANKRERERREWMGQKKQLRIERKRNPYDSSGKKEREMREHHTFLFVFSSSVVVVVVVVACVCSRWEEKKGDIDRDKTKEYRHQNEYYLQKIKGN